MPESERAETERSVPALALVRPRIPVVSGPRLIEMARLERVLAPTGRLIGHEMMVRLEWRNPQARKLEELLDHDFLQALEADPDADWGTVETHIYDHNRPGSWRPAAVLQRLRRAL
jgi:hypothetical protein